MLAVMNKPNKNPYADTLNLPQTNFPMRAGLAQNEPKWVEKWLEEDIYGKIRAKRRAENAPKFILHLGPPYANGNMHMGHALTYILKDFIVRSQFMAGNDAPYVPGWDCHGLPIEWKVEEGIRADGKTKYDYSVKEIRDKCRAYASKWISVQKSEWQRFGALGDWENPYKTMDYANEAGIVAELGKMVQRGLVYKGLRSTLWSTVEETALAEAEIEYKDKKSTAIYVAYKVPAKAGENIVIWTTTPWTMPNSRGIAYAEDEEYIALNVTDVAEDSGVTVGQTYWVATALQADFIRAVGITEFATVGTQKGADFANWEAEHPFYAERKIPLVHGFHVTTDSGTGFVHMAPAHGQEDFQVGRENNMELHCSVLGDGKYDHTVADLPATDFKLEGMNIWKAQAPIVAEMTENGSLLKSYEFTHSYPVSWRSKAPLIYRATPQWFISLDDKIDALGGESLRETALQAIHGGGKIDKVNWLPDYGENRIGSMIKNRPDWCISRQRSWGVPITIFLHKKTGDMVTDSAVWAHISSLVAVEGIDAWDSRIDDNRVAELFPDGWLDANGHSADDFEPMRDIMDVWIDSGTSHAHVLRADSDTGGRFERTENDATQRPADLYQEGSDQHRGWFHSSLLTSVANYGDAPYAAVLTSGFVVDGDGRKFSKSLGNGVEPRELWDKYGMDIVRLWVAGSDYTEDIRYSEEIIKNNADAYRRYRNTFRFLLGNLSGFAAEKDTVCRANLPELEQYILHRLSVVLEEARTAFMGYKFHQGMRALYDFCNADLSNFYFDVRKDALYCDGENAPRRRATQTVLFHILEGLTTHLAPILPFTCDEVWRTWFGENNSVHLESYKDGAADWRDLNLAEKWTAILATRTEVNELIETELRSQGKVGANVDVAATLPHHHGLTPDAWTEVLNISVVHAEEGALAVAPAAETTPLHKCPRCWMFAAPQADSLCARCTEATGDTAAA